MKEKYDYKNLTQAQQDCLSLIESLGIYELRALARVFGDNSPTTLKRNDHIKIVMDKIISGEDIKPLPLRQGRPYKEIGSIEGVLSELSQITGKDYTLKSVQQRTTSRPQKSIVFKQIEQDVIKQKLFPIEVKGILCERSDKDLCFVNQENGKYVLVKKSFDSRLRPFDYVTGTAVVMNKENEYILDTLSSINYRKADSYIDSSDEYQEILPTKVLKIAGKDILLGARYRLNHSKFADCAKETKVLVEKLKENKIIPIALIPNFLPTDAQGIQSIGFFNTFLIKYDASAFDAYEIISNFVEHIKNLQAQGCSVALFVEDVPTLSNLLDFNFKSNTKAFVGHAEQTVEILKKIMLLAKAGKENKSTTLFTSFDETDLFDQTYVSSVYKISKKLDL